MAEPGWPTRGTGGADAWQEATRTRHAGARVGRHVACGGGAGRWRAHGNSGTLVTVGDGNAMKTKGSSPI